MNTAIDEIERIKEILSQLPPSVVHEIRDFTAYLADRERRRKKLIERVLKAEKNPETVRCANPDEFIHAIMNADNVED